MAAWNRVRYKDFLDLFVTLYIGKYSFTEERQVKLASDIIFELLVV